MFLHQQFLGKGVDVFSDQRYELRAHSSQQWSNMHSSAMMKNKIAKNVVYCYAVPSGSPAKSEDLKNICKINQIRYKKTKAQQATQ